MKACDLMISEVTHCKPTTTLESIALAMWDKNCGCVPVINEANQPVGIITDRDIAISAALRYRPLWEIQARDVMDKRPLYTCHINDDLDIVQERMRQHQVRRLPIVDDKRALAGVISVGDIVAVTDVKQQTSRALTSTIDMLKAVSAHYHDANRLVLSA